MKKVCAAICSFIALVVLFTGCLPFTTAWAVNLDYLELDKWNNNDKVTFQSVNAEALGQNLTGEFGYYFDSDLCFYTYFSVSGDLIANNYDLCKIRYIVHMPDEDYDFSIGKDGMCDAPSQEQKVFNVYQNFDNAGNGTFITAAEYTKNVSSYTVDVIFYNSSKAFIIQEGIEVFEQKEEKTTRPASNTNSKSGKTSSSSTTKKSTTTKSGKKSSSSSSGTTKFTPSGDSFEAANADEFDTTAYGESGSEYIDLNNGNKKLNKLALLLLIAGIIVAITGVFLIALAIVKDRAEKKKEAEKEEKETDEEPDGEGKEET